MEQLVAAIYDAALDAELWPTVVETLAAAVGASGAHLFVTTTPGTAPVCLAEHGFDPDHRAAYDEHYFAVDPWRVAGAEGRPVGVVEPSEALVPVPELRRTEFWADWLRPQELEHGFGSLLARSPDGRIANVIGIREARKGPFDRDETTTLQRLVPHLQRALHLAARIGTLEHELRVATTLLDRLPQGVMLVDGDLRVLHANRAARALLTRREELRVTRGTLELRSASHQRLLSAAVGRCVASARAAGTPLAESLVLPVEKPHAPLVVDVGPAPPDAAPLLRGAVVAAVWLAEVRPTVPREALLRAVYGLTPMEAHLVVQLARGLTLEEASAERGVRLETVRSHLKHALEKTGCRRQAELVGLAASGPFPLGDPDADA